LKLLIKLITIYLILNVSWATSIKICGPKFAKKLRTCIPDKCSLDLSKYYKELGLSEKVLKTFRIQREGGFCKIRISSEYFDTKECRLPLPFNRIYQESIWPRHSVDFLYGMKKVNDVLASVENKEDLNKFNVRKNRFLINYASETHAQYELKMKYPHSEKIIRDNCQMIKNESSLDKKKKMDELILKDGIRISELRFKLYPFQMERKQSINKKKELILQLEKLCEKDDKLSCKRLVAFFSQQRVFSKVIYYAEKLCSQSDTSYCNMASFFHRQEQKYPQAIAVGKKSCESGDKLGCFELVESYCATRDKANAKKSLKRSVELGFQDLLELRKDSMAKCFHQDSFYKELLNSWQ
jgi:hypothetical protein